MEKIELSEKVTNEQVLERMGKMRTLPNNIQRTKANLTGINTIFLSIISVIFVLKRI